MTPDPAFERLLALDIDRCTEEERQSAIHEVSLVLEQIGKKRKSIETITARLQLLRVWHRLARLRVADVQADVAPPDDPISPTERLFPEDELTEESEVDMDDEIIVPEEPPLDTDFERPEDMVAVRLLEAGIINGMRLPAGIVVDVPIMDADVLIATGRARYLEEDESKS